MEWNGMELYLRVDEGRGMHARAGFGSDQRIPRGGKDLWELGMDVWVIVRGG